MKNLIRVAIFSFICTTAQYNYTMTTLEKYILQSLQNCSDVPTHRYSHISRRNGNQRIVYEFGPNSRFDTIAYTKNLTKKPNSYEISAQSRYGITILATANTINHKQIKLSNINFIYPKSLQSN